MSSFHTLTFLLIITIAGIVLSLEGPWRFLIPGLLVTGYLILFTLGVFRLRLNFFIKAYCRGNPMDRWVSITFDDGPDPEATSELLKILKRHEITAAFFPIGKKIEESSALLKQIDQEGHIIGNHSFQHAWYTNFMFFRSLDSEIERAQDAIEKVIGKVPAFFRPPMGLTNPHLKRALQKQDLSLIGWDIRPFDIGTKADLVIKRILKSIRNGSIILLHDTKRSSVDLGRLADDLITEIKRRDFEFKSLEELIAIPAYQTMKQKNKTESAFFLSSGAEPIPPPGPGRLRRTLIQRLASTAYVRKAIKEPVNLDCFKETPSSKFITGVGLVLFSYVLGWPMVGLFGILSAYYRAPKLLIAGPVCLGISHLVFLLGMVLAGRDCLKYAESMLRWGLCRIVSKNGNREI